MYARELTSQQLNRAAARLLSDSGPQLAKSAMSGSEWLELTHAATAQRAWPLVAGAIRDGSLIVGAEERRQAAQHAADSLARCVELDRELLTVHRLLADAGIPHSVLKGPAHAALYPDPALRSYSDVDLLVPSSEFTAAAEAIQQAGFLPRQQFPTTAEVGRFGKGKTYTGPSGIEVDLHRSIAPGPWGVAMSEAFDPRWHESSIRLGTESVPALSMDLRFLHSCYNAVLSRDQRGLQRTLDVAMFIERAPISSDGVLELAVSWKGRLVVARAVNEATSQFGLEQSTEIIRWAGRYSPTPREALWSFAAELPGGAGDFARTLSMVDASDKPAAYVGHVLFHEGRSPWPVRVRRLLPSMTRTRHGNGNGRYRGETRQRAPRTEICIVGPLLGGREERVLMAEEQLAAQLSGEGYRVRGTSTQSGRLHRLFDTLWCIWRWRSSTALAIHSLYSGPAFFVTAVSSWFAEKLGIPQVAVLRGGQLPAFSRRHPSWFRRVGSRMRILVAPSSYLAEQLPPLGERRVITNVLPHNSYPRRTRKTARPRILWMRAFEPIYNPRLALEALRKLVSDWPDAMLTMAGPDRGLRRDTELLAAELGLEDHVRFVGFLDEEAKAEAFSSHDIFLNTNTIDNTPVSLIEAASCGLVIVSTDVGGIPYLFEHETDALLVRDNDAVEAARALTQVLGNDALAESLSTRAQQLGGRHTWPAVRNEWRRVVEEIGGIMPPADTTPLTGHAAIDVP